MNAPLPTRRAFGAHLLFVATLAGAVLAAGFSPQALADRAVQAPEPRRANAVVQWNSIAEEVFTPSQGTNPMAHSRIFAILHASIHDALNAIDRRYESYTAGLPQAPEAHPDAAVAAAAREVLALLMPERATLVEAAYDRALAGIADGEAKTAGIALGRAAAAATLKRRQDDGAASAGVPYVPGSAAGEYRFTPPFDFAAQPGWGRFALQLGVACGAMAAVVLAGRTWVGDWTALESVAQRVGWLAAVIAAGAGTFGLVLLSLGLRPRHLRH